MPSKLVGHKMLTLLTWSLDFMYMYMMAISYLLTSCNLTILNRLRLRPPHPAMDQLVQDFNTALDETAGSGSARSVLLLDSEKLIVKDFLNYLFSFRLNIRIILGLNKTESLHFTFYLKVWSFKKKSLEEALQVDQQFGEYLRILLF